MRIVLVSSFVPHIHGGARFIVEWTEDMLRSHGHEVERFYLPFVDDPDDLLRQVASFRLIDLSESSDLLVAFRPPAYVLPHPRKVLWFIHHIRYFYDLWDRPYGGSHSHPREGAVRQSLVTLDTAALAEARKVYTNSQVVADRLRRFNATDAQVLYPPIWRPERFHHRDYGEEVVMLARVEPHKRQMLAIEAMSKVKSGVRLRLCGTASTPAYAAEVRRRIADLGVQDRIVFEDRWISEAEKVEILADALAVAYLPYDEDSYGYPSLEAAHADKSVITTDDSGGVLELVQDQVNGAVCEPTSAALAEAFDQLYLDRPMAARRGRANRERVAALQIDWSRVVEALTG